MSRDHFLIAFLNATFSRLMSGISERARPLVEVARMYVEQIQTPQTTKAAIDAALGSLREFLINRISYQEAKKACVECLNDSMPADRINSIINLASGRCNKRSSLPPTPCMMSKRCRVWTTDDDFLLLAGIYRYGLGDWRNISNFVGGQKSRAQCSQRWSRALNPSIARESWSQSEDQELMRIVNKNGAHNWSKIAHEMRNRSDVQCRYRYIQLSKGEGQLQAPDSSYYGKFPPQDRAQFGQMRSATCKITLPSISELMAADSAVCLASRL